MECQVQREDLIIRSDSWFYKKRDNKNGRVLWSGVIGSRSVPVQRHGWVATKVGRRDGCLRSRKVHHGASEPSKEESREKESK